jgi:transcription elongation factor
MLPTVFKEGDRVEVIRGIYTGCLGVVDGNTLRGVPVMIELHGRPLHMTEIPAESLRLLDPPL